MLSTWLEKLRESYAGEDDATDPAHGTLAAMGTEAIASALAARGGIGNRKNAAATSAQPAADAASSLTPSPLRRQDCEQQDR